VDVSQRETDEVWELTFKDGAVEFHIHTGFVDFVRNREVRQFWCRSRELCQLGLEAWEDGTYVQPPEAMDVVQCGGKEGLHVILVFQELMDVEKLLPGSSKKAHRLLWF
jgi:hypothetical protein